MLVVDFRSVLEIYQGVLAHFKGDCVMEEHSKAKLEDHPKYCWDHWNFVDYLSYDACETHVEKPYGMCFLNSIPVYDSYFILVRR